VADILCLDREVEVSKRNTLGRLAVSEVNAPLPPIDDPIEDIVAFVKFWSRRLLLSLLNEDAKIDPGESMTIPNEVEPLHIYFEKLESEPSPRRKVAQQLRRSRERTQERLVEQAVQMYSVLFANRRLR
jgi:hypothetical protein